MQFSTYRDRHIRFNKIMLRAKTKKIIDKLVNTRFKEVRGKNEAALNEMQQHE